MNSFTKHIKFLSSSRDNNNLPFRIEKKARYLIFILIFLSNSLLFSQDNTAEDNLTPVNPAEDNTTEDNTSQASPTENDDNILKIIQDFNQFIDSEGFSSLRPDYEKNLFDAIKNSVDRTEDFVNSLLFTMNQLKQDLDDEIQLKRLEFYNPFPVEKSYYNYISTGVDYDFFLLKSISFLERINSIYQENNERLTVALGFEPIQEVAFGFKSLLAIIYYYKGSYKDILNSIKTFKDILGENPNAYVYAQDSQDRNLIYPYLVSAYSILTEFNHPSVDYISAVDFKRERLFYLWQLILSFDDENEQLTTLKLKKLAIDNYNNMDKNGERFREIYAPFMIENNIIIEE